ncbi:hypothetical protein [Lactobacillus delbrueckii]|uniref:hypothetical protein n=1 Tax=Lactobacillus delbrueckii TaxID=1584 RepID=UPI001F2B4681|nr:hypothetical protein [Lactobacillus delbrueckii]GHN35718.1 hypothetical protein ME792_08440 [Lactobacillus delbrueckii]
MREMEAGRVLYYVRRGTVIAIVCAIVAFLIWYPFMKRFDLKTYKKEQEEAKQNANA